MYPKRIGAINDAAEYQKAKNDIDCKNIAPPYLEVYRCTCNVNQGRGIRTKKSFRKGEYILYYNGVTRNNLPARPDTNLYLFEIKDGAKTKYIDARREDRSLGRLINDSHHSPNLKVRCIKSTNGEVYPAFFALCDLKKNTPLCYDYGGCSKNYFWRRYKKVCRCHEDSQEQVINHANHIDGNKSQINENESRKDQGKVDIISLLTIQNELANMKKENQKLLANIEKENVLIHQQLKINTASITSCKEDIKKNKEDFREVIKEEREENRNLFYNGFNMMLKKIFGKGHELPMSGGLKQLTNEEEETDVQCVIDNIDSPQQTTITEGSILDEWKAGDVIRCEDGTTYTFVSKVAYTEANKEGSTSSAVQEFILVSKKKPSFQAQDSNFQMEDSNACIFPDRITEDNDEKGSSVEASHRCAFEDNGRTFESFDNAPHRSGNEKIISRSHEDNKQKGAFVVDDGDEVRISETQPLDEYERLRWTPNSEKAIENYQPFKKYLCDFKNEGDKGGVPKVSELKEFINKNTKICENLTPNSKKEAIKSKVLGMRKTNRRRFKKVADQYFS